MPTRPTGFSASSAPTPRRQARRHQLPALRHGDARRRGASPISMISGASPFCETFFTDVKVPKGNLVGERQQGLDHRQAPVAARARDDFGHGPRRRGFRRRPSAVSNRRRRTITASRTAASPARRCATTSPARRWTARPSPLTMRAVRPRKQKRARRPGAASSIFKYVRHRAQQAPLRTAARNQWARKGLGWEGEGFTGDEITVTRSWLRSKAKLDRGRHQRGACSTSFPSAFSICRALDLKQ